MSHDYPHSPPEFNRGVNVTVRRADSEEEGRVRLYCTAASPPHSEPRWALQLRGHGLRADGSRGASSFYAHASFTMEDMIALHEALGEQIMVARKRQASEERGLEWNIFHDAKRCQR